MIRKDYFLRLIEQATKGIRYVLMGAAAGDYAEAHEAVGESLRQLLGLGLGSVANLSDEALLGILQLHHAQDWRERSLVVAALLKTEGDVCGQEGRERAQFNHYLKSLHLLLAASETAVDLPEPIPSVAELVGLLQDYVLPAHSYEALLDYYERTNQLAAGEDVLFTWLEEGHGGETAVSAGIAFFQRLTEKSDAELEAGSLPRTEVEAGLTELLETGD
ncbi:MAG: hypothetical protein H6658_13075 [Ardenticatenaceae bacterium]|nr:hypothetical protein [Ardenticatenaceae bacterium]